MPIGAHLAELRRRLIISFFAVAAGMAAAFPFAGRLIDWLGRPLNQPLYFFSPTEAFWVHVKVALFGGLLLALPVLFHQLWRFIAPALYRAERRATLIFVGASVIAFALGVAFCHLVAFPFALRFLIDFGLSGGLTPVLSVGTYIGFAIKFYLAFGLIFEVPLALTLLARLGLLTAAGLARRRRHALLANAIGAAVLTPTADLFNMMLMLVPLTLLYEVGILGARLFGRRPIAIHAPVEGEQGARS
ncbi:MAG: twin-arginine translocase subunit TatC [Nitrospirota bacterium]